MSHYLSNMSYSNSVPETSQIPVKTEPASPCSVKVKTATNKPKRYSRPRIRCRSPTVVQRIKKTRRLKANDRERSRMHGLNHALEKLRVILPPNPDETKLTKIETLRVAIMYIQRLKEVLDETGTNGNSDGSEPTNPDLFQNGTFNNDKFLESMGLTGINHENLDAIFGGLQWPTSPANASWCVSESSDDSFSIPMNFGGYSGDVPMDNGFNNFVWIR